MKNINITMDCNFILSETQLRQIIEILPELGIQCYEYLFKFPDLIEDLLQNDKFVANLPQLRKEFIENPRIEINMDQFICENGGINEKYFDVISRVLDIENNSEIRKTLFMKSMKIYPILTNKIMEMGIDPIDNELINIMCSVAHIDLIKRVFEEYPQVLRNIDNNRHPLKTLLLMHRFDDAIKLFDYFPQLPELSLNFNIFALAIINRNFFQKLLTTYEIRFSQTYDYSHLLFSVIFEARDFTKEDFIFLLEKTQLDITKINQKYLTLPYNFRNENSIEIMDYLFDLKIFDHMTHSQLLHIIHILSSKEDDSESTLSILKKIIYHPSFVMEKKHISYFPFLDYELITHIRDKLPLHDLQNIDLVLGKNELYHNKNNEDN